MDDYLSAMNLSPLPIQKFFSNNGRPLVGGRLFTYVAGTDTKIATYIDSSGGTPNTNPIKLDFRGECRLWIDPQQAYKFTLAPPGNDDPPTNPIWTVDDITAAPLPFDFSGVDDGSVNNIELTIPLLQSLEAFARISFQVAHTNTGSTTIQINGGSAAPLVWQSGVEFVGGEVRASGIYQAIFDGASWQLQGPPIELVPEDDDIQAALDLLLSKGGVLTLTRGKTYTVSSPLTLVRTSSGDATEMIIEGNGATLNCPTLIGSQVAMTIGASSPSFFLEQGCMVVRNLTILGPEAGSPLSSDPTTDTIGLLCSVSGRVELDNVQVRKFKTGIRTTFAFPLKATNVSARGNWIGLHCDEASNLQDWDSLQTPNCRYGILIRSSTTSFDSGKSNNINFMKWWPEGSLVGCVVDTGSGGIGAVRFRSFTWIDPYISGITYDVFRLGTQFTFSTPDVRGSNCSEFLNDIRMIDGLWNPAGGAWTATNAAIAYDSVQRIRHALIDIPVVSKTADADVFVNAPSGGVVRTRAFPGIADGVVTEYLYDSASLLVRRFNPNGTIMLGANKATAGAISELGIEVAPDGVVWATASGAPAIRLNRQTSAGILAAFYQANNLVGFLNANAGDIDITLDSTNNVRLVVNNGNPNSVVTAGPGSICLNRAGGASTSLYVKESGTGNTGWVAK